MNRTIAFIALFVFAASVSSAAFAQNQAEMRRVVLLDGSVIVGTVDDPNADPVVVVTRDGIEQRIPQRRIREITALAGGKFARLDPTRTRLAVSPTARTLGDAGTVRLGFSFYIFPTATYAVSDRIDLTGAAFVFFGGGGGGLILGGAKGQVIDTESFDFAVGTNIVAPISTSEDFNGAFVALPYGVATIGSETTAATVGVSGFFGGDVTSGNYDFANAFVINGGAEHQISDRLKLLAEVWVPMSDGASGAMFFPGVRFFGDSFSADIYGTIGSIEGDVFGFAPFATFSYTF